MKFENPKCPKCGSYASGIVETITGVASLMEPDETGSIDYGGETKVCWDSQLPERDSEGNVTLVCSSCELDWSTKRLEA